MNRRHQNITLIASACLTLLVIIGSNARAATIITHTGNANPSFETPEWTPAPTDGGGQGSGVVHLGEPAWKLTDGIGDHGEKYGYDDIAAADFADPSGWTVEWRMAGANLKTLAGDDEAGLQVRDGYRVMSFLLEVNGAGDNDGAALTQRFGAAVLKTDIPTISSRATGFHTFALDYDGTPGGAGLYRLFYDNTLLTDSVTTPAMIGAANSSYLLRWGGFGGNTADERVVESYWSSVVFRTGTVVPVPEPNGAALLVLGTAVAGACKLRRISFFRQAAR
jgi:hypothetical protein